jgi:hypothetical protein|tara:strand:- start:1565 stop:2635 length:1071 start_codon:yes stop_codon:yes gene_type:complete
MSHFAVLVVLPKDYLEKNEEANNRTGDEAWHNAYNNQWYHSQLEDTLAPYNENPEDEDSSYFERCEDLNEQASKIYASYMNKQWTQLAEEINSIKAQHEKWDRMASITDKHAKGGFRSYTESEIATRLEPFEKMYGIMSTEKFDLSDDDHRELFVSLFCHSQEIVWNLEDNVYEIYDVYYQNLNAKWDWWVVGGRWRNMGDNGFFQDISVFSQEETIPLWKEELGFKLKKIEMELGIENRDEYTEDEYDKLIEDYIASDNPIVRLYDRETQEPKEYYDKKVLLSMVTRKKESTWAMLFPEEGWIEAGEMGWFGMSSLDTMELDKREQIIADQNKLTDNLIEKYKDTHIGLIVDCHI